MRMRCRAQVATELKGDLVFDALLCPVAARAWTALPLRWLALLHCGAACVGPVECQ